MKIFKYIEFINEDKELTKYIPTYEECRQICDANGNLIFYESKTEIDGFQVSIFNYRLASFNNFATPIPDHPEINARELRGICFVFNKDGSLFKGYLLLDKFFNLDQTPDSMYSVVKNYKVLNIMEKKDGSIASFIRLPNGKVVGKSKTSFQSDQAIEVQRIYDSDKILQRFINWCFDNNIDAIFEFVSPTNRIVIPYANAQLILLRLRDNRTGKYLDINKFADKLDGLSVCNFENENTLDGLIDAAKVVDNIEGWVVEFANGQMIKLKTRIYQERHNLYFRELSQENTLIQLILNDTMDDVICQLPPDDPKRDQITEITKIIDNYIIKSSKEIDNLISKYKGDRKQFAIEYRKNKWFPISINVILGEKDKLEMIKNHIISETKNLMMARRWIEENN